LASRQKRAEGVGVRPVRLAVEVFSAGGLNVSLAVIRDFPEGTNEQLSSIDICGHVRRDS
jgi:hypothetical protein